MRTRILAILLICLISYGCQSDEVVIANKPLYEDPTGWEIRTAKPGDVVVYHFYEKPVSRIGKQNLPAGFGKAFQEMSRKGAHNFYAFVLVIPEGQTTFWSDAATIFMTYRAHGRTYEAYSKDFFVIEKCSLAAVRPKGFLQIPSPAFDIFDTNNKRPVLFVEFDFPAEPDTILYCDVANVQSN